MSSAKFPLLAFVFVLLLLLGGIMFVSNRKLHKAAVVTQTASSSPAPSNPVNNTSDTQLNNDVQNIDSNVNAVDTSANAADQGLQDQQTNLQ